MRLVEVHHLVALLRERGVEQVILEMIERLEQDFLRWADFDKSPRYAAHSPGGVIELMPVAGATAFACKYVNGHPGNFALGLQTVTGFGVLADVATGYPTLLAEMTLTTALRTAATSVMAAKRLARPDSRTMALIGLGAQAEFQAAGFAAALGIRELRVFDVAPRATAKFLRNVASLGLNVSITESAGEAARGADIVTTVTADKRVATVLADGAVTAGMHLNAVGGDCPGKTELDPAILDRVSVFVEYEPQTRIEGEIQQAAADFPVTELWRVIAGEAPGRQSSEEITLFDSVGFALEDFSALRYLDEVTREPGLHTTIDLLATPGDPRDLFGLVAGEALRAAA